MFLAYEREGRGQEGSICCQCIRPDIPVVCHLLQTCVIRAWDLSKPLLFCPAMNTAMWEHPITAQQVEQLKSFGYVEIPCIVKKLVCGDEGEYLASFRIPKFRFPSFRTEGLKTTEMLLEL